MTVIGTIINLDLVITGSVALLCLRDVALLVEVAFIFLQLQN